MSQLFTFTLWISEFELRSSGLAASAFTPELAHWPFALPLAGSYLWAPVIQACFHLPVICTFLILTKTRFGLNEVRQTLNQLK